MVGKIVAAIVSISIIIGYVCIVADIAERRGQNKVFVRTVEVCAYLNAFHAFRNGERAALFAEIGNEEQVSLMPFGVVYFIHIVSVSVKISGLCRRLCGGIRKVGRNHRKVLHA